MDLEKIYKIQNSEKKEDLKKLQNAQKKLKKIFLKEIEKEWKEYAKKSKIKSIIKLGNKKGKILINKEIAEKFHLKEHFKEFEKKINISTAGIRSFINPLHKEDARMFYNEVFLSLIIEAEAKFLKEVHNKRKKEIKKAKEKIDKIKKYFKKGEVEVIESIFKCEFETILSFLEKYPFKIIGGEVRPFTPFFIELEARILAENGIKVITMQKFDQSFPVYIISFLTFLLGIDGSSYYTSSHSPNYIYGRKVFSFNGSQYLPKEYKRVKEILKKLIENCYKKGVEIKFSERESENILRTLDYKKIAKLYCKTIELKKEEKEIINKATKKGHRIILNCLNGCTWKSIKSFLEELEINKKVFKVVMKEEDSFFDVGYFVFKDNKGYKVGHLGVDSSLKEVSVTIPYIKILKGERIGTKIYECDPDSDRFVLKQILEKKDVRKLKEYGIPFLELDENKVLALYSPNKTFLCLDVFRVEREKSNFVHIMSYVSSYAIREFCEKEGIPELLARVGFKNLTELQRKIEKDLGKKEILIEDHLGNKVKIKTGNLKILSKEEESGGRVEGFEKAIFNVLGKSSLALPEKSSFDSLIAELLLSSKFFLEKNENYLLTNYLDYIYGKYKLKTKKDFRIEIFHGLQEEVLEKDFSGGEVYLKKCLEKKRKFNKFFFSIAKKRRKEAIKELESKFPEFKKDWIKLKRVYIVYEKIGKRKLEKGVVFEFEKNSRIKRFIIRPSGTDPFKTKIYVESEKINEYELELLKRKLKEYAL